MTTTATASTIAADIAAKQGRADRYSHLGSLRYWLAWAAEHPSPDGECYRIREHQPFQGPSQTLLMCWSDGDHAWFPARSFRTHGQPRPRLP